MAKKSRITVWVKHPDKKPEKRTIDNTLSSFQRLVGGYIEVASLSMKDAIVCNEEGLILGLPYNCTMAGSTGIKRFVGTIVLVSINGEEFSDAVHALDSYGERETRCYVCDLPIG